MTNKYSHGGGRNLKKKGFALIEILTVTVVVLVIFTMLYSNLYPLIGEYEKRLTYNDVETQYISFYMRKLYKDASVTLNTNDYQVLYNNTNKCVLLSDPAKTKCMKLASSSDLVSMIVTKKSLNTVKEHLDDDDLKEVADYINYLPNYTLKSEEKEPYRLIIKTKMGYATTELKVKGSGKQGAEFLIKKVGTGGLVAEEHPATEQLQATTAYRYIGADPDNYIKFNNETWRIIGVFDTDDGTGKLEKRIKIIGDFIGWEKWDSFDRNDWSKANLKTLLNEGNYYNRRYDYSSNGLTHEAKNQIADAKWYSGGSSTYNDVTANMFYERERGTTVYSRNPTSWIGKVGLMYPSDCGYATAGGTTINREACLAKELYGWYDSSYSDCKDNDWLYDSSNLQWTITPRSNTSAGVFSVSPTGEVALDKTSRRYAVHPSIYLKSDIRLSGNGTSIEPFVIEK